MKKCLDEGVISQRFTFHDIRAKYATDMALAGRKDEASKSLGHQSVKTTEIYIRKHEFHFPPFTPKD